MDPLGRLLAFSTRPDMGCLLKGAVWLSQQNSKFALLHGFGKGKTLARHGARMRWELLT